MPDSIDDLLKTYRTLESVSESARLDAELLLAFVLGKDRSYLYTWPERTIPTHQSKLFSDLIEKRRAGHPIAHLIGQKEFWSLPFKVNESTLIPRPETELLVEFCVERIELLLRARNTNIRVLDMGTGTGAIAIAIAKTFPNIHVDGIDKIPDAIQLAKSNQEINQVENVSFFDSDWFSKVTNKYDVIVSNPPYIAPEDSHLSCGDVRFEPRSALIASENGFADILDITRQSATYLKSDGLLCFEHGYNQSTEVRSVMEQAGFIKIETKKDYGGRDRITYGWV